MYRQYRAIEVADWVRRRAAHYLGAGIESAEQYVAKGSPETVSPVARFAGSQRLVELELHCVADKDRPTAAAIVEPSGQIV